MSQAIPAKSICKEIYNTTTEVVIRKYFVHSFFYETDLAYQDCDTLEFLEIEPTAWTGQDVRLCKTYIPFTPRCLLKRTVCVWYDNGVTPGSSTNDCGARPNFIHYNQDFVVVWRLTGAGVVWSGDPLAWFAGWTPQLQGWADFATANDPYECTAAFWFLPAPTWRYMKVTCCDPNAQYWPLTIRNTTAWSATFGCTYTIYPVISSQEFDRIYEYARYCEQTGEKQMQYCKYEDWVYTNIETPEDIECYVPCEFDFKPFIIWPTSNCITKEYRVCDKLADDTLVEIIIFVDDCDWTRTTTTYLLSDYLNATTPEIPAYNIQWALVDCDSWEEFVIPDPECSIDDTVKIKKVWTRTYESWKRSIWIWTPANDPTVTHSIVVDWKQYDCTITNDWNKADMVAALQAEFISKWLNVTVNDINPDWSQINIIIVVDCESVVTEYKIKWVASIEQTVAATLAKEECVDTKVQQWEWCNDDRRDDLLQAAVDKLCDFLWDWVVEKDKVICDVTVQATYATIDYDITWMCLAGIDVWSEFTLPVDWNNAPAFNAWRDELDAFLQAQWYTTTITQGRDWFTLEYTGECIEIKTTPADAIWVSKENCSDEDDSWWNDPIWDQIICASRKLGADFSSSAAWSWTHATWTLYDTNWPVIAWSGTFVVTDSAWWTHTFTDWQTVTGLASGSTQQVTFTWNVYWSDPDTGEEYRCDVNDKPISANFTVQ